MTRARTPAEVYAAGTTAIAKRRAFLKHMLAAILHEDERARLTDELDALAGFEAGVDWLRQRGWIGDGRGAA